MINNHIQTIYGYIDNNVVIEIPTGYEYKVRASYPKSKPTFFNLGLQWMTGDYRVIKIFDFQKED